MQKKAIRTMIFILLLAPVKILYAQKSGFTFKREQKVYVVAVNFGSRDLSLTGGSLEIEGKAREQFRKEKKFVLSGSPKEADFVFLILIDQLSRRLDETALAILPDDYVKYGSNLDGLRTVALWQDASHFKGSQEAKGTALAAGTLGVGNLFYRPSVAKSLVKQFHKDIHL
jgi:hypothetical protein